MVDLLKSKPFWMWTGGVTGAALLLSVGLTRGVIAPMVALPEGAEMPDLSSVAEPAADADDGPLSSSSRPNSARSKKSSYYKNPVVERSIFDSSKVGVEPGPGPGNGDPSIQLADLDVVLIATLVAVPNTFSSALIAVQKDSKGQGFGIGDTIEGFEIVDIQRQGVLVKKGSEEGWLFMDDSQLEKPAATASSGTPKLRDDDPEDGITESGGKIIVERRVVDEALENVDSLATKMRVVPHKDADGNIDGYRLSAIRRGSLFDKLGIRNGDIVHGVNGMPLVSTDAAFQAYQTLQNDSSFSFEVTRRNQRQTYEYEIR